MTINKKFLSIDINAAKKIVQHRDFQSTEYDKGAALSLFLQDGTEYKDNELHSEELSSEGLLIRTKTFDKSKTLIFDLATFEGFRECNERDSLVLFQKLCRLAIKLWENLKLTSSENNIDSKYVVLSPFSFKTGYFKAAIDKRPDEKRQDRRGGNHFLVFKSGYDQFDLKSSTNTNLRKCLDTYTQVNTTVEPTVEEDSNGIDILKLDKLKTEVSEFIGFDGIKGHLTSAQKKFIYSPSNGPARLEGAAGTGKTLTLILRCIQTLKIAKEKNENKKILFITHSTETKKNIESIFHANSGGEFFSTNSLEEKYHVKISTLQEWCIELLGNKIAETEYLDKDARDSKETQLLYLYDIVEDFKKTDLESFSKMISPELASYLKAEESWTIAELLQTEISTYIKGRAGENLERYKKIERSKYVMPITTDEDYDCIYSLYNEYQSQLEAIGQFDSDDIVLTAIGELETPIWRRRRAIDGFESIFVDETHLFNINELCLFHFLTKPTCSTNMIFTIDRSQAIGDSTLSKYDVRSALNILENEVIEDEDLNTVFRSSPDILNFASHILSSGASLFTSFENPLLNAVGSFTMAEENKCIKPTIKKYLNDQQLIEQSFEEVVSISSQLNCTRSKVAIIPTTDSLCKKIEEYAESNNKAFEIIKHRGDTEKVKKAGKGGKFLISGIDYVGGLEFDAVVIVGADKGRVPPTNSDAKGESKHYITYATYNRLYVAITRAKYAITVTYTGSRGLSEILHKAIENKVLDLDTSSATS